MNIHTLHRIDGGPSTIRIADPPFDTSHTPALHLEGIVVSLFREPLLDDLEDALEEIGDDGFDAIQWYVSYDDLVTRYLACFYAGDQLRLDQESREEIGRQADALERAARRLREVL